MLRYNCMLACKQPSCSTSSRQACCKQH
jgi:hypothetical protein